MDDEFIQGTNSEPSPFIQKTSSSKIWVIVGISIFVMIIILAFFLFFYKPKCTESWSCGSWSACANNVQRRNCTDTNNCGVITNKPSILRSCAVNCTSFTYSNWNNCSSGTQTRTVLTSSPTGCTGGSPRLSQNCTPNPVNCTSFTYSNWNNCSSGTQTRTVLTSSPSGCTGGSPRLSQSCTNSINQSCSDKGLYLMTGGSNEICNGNMTITITNNETQICCSVHVIISTILSSELRTVWNSISNSGNCSITEYVSKLESCSPYKCGYINPLTGGNFNKGVIGNYYGKCSSLDELPNNGEQYCQYNNTQLSSVVNYFTFMFEQCGPTGFECEYIMNETGYYINDIPTENVLQNMYTSGDCSATFDE